MAKSIRVTFLGPRQCRFVYVSTVLMDHTHSYLLVNRGAIFNHYLRLGDGEVELVKMGITSQAVAALKDYSKFPLTHAARIYRRSTLLKSDEVLDVLNRILKNKDPDRLNFLPPLAPRGNGEQAPRMGKRDREELRANMVSLEQICHELGLEPRLVRSTFRRAKVEKPGSRWAWPKSQYPQILKLVKQSMG